MCKYLYGECLDVHFKAKSSKASHVVTCTHLCFRDIFMGNLKQNKPNLSEEEVDGTLPQLRRSPLTLLYFCSKLLQLSNL